MSYGNLHVPLSGFWFPFPQIHDWLLQRLSSVLCLRCRLFQAVTVTKSLLPLRAQWSQDTSLLAPTAFFSWRESPCDVEFFPTPFHLCHETMGPLHLPCVSLIQTPCHFFCGTLGTRSSTLYLEGMNFTTELIVTQWLLDWHWHFFLDVFPLDPHLDHQH